MARLGIVIVIALFEMATVIVLRVHCTMDVLAGAVIAGWIAPTCDHRLNAVGHRIGLI